MNGWIDTKALRERTSTKKVPRELDQIHTYLAAVGASCKYIFEYTNCFKFEMPSWVARLPTQVGYLAGGSLSADEWKCLGLVYGPIVVCTLLVYNSIFEFLLTCIHVQLPLIWDEWYPRAEQDLAKQMENWDKNEQKRLRHLASGSTKPADKNPAPKPTIRMLKGDADNFLKLAAALKIILGRSIYDADMPRAKALLEDYLKTFFEVIQGQI